VQDETLRFLEQLALEDPSLAEATLDAEVDSVLGRTPAKPRPKTAREPIRIDDDEEPERGPDFSWYGALVANAPQLDEQETADVAQAVEVGLFAQQRLSELDWSTAKRRDVADLNTLIAEGNAAWETLILANIRLVFHWSKGVARSVDSDWAQDAFQVGVIGLMRGLQGWDYSMGYRLSTFVTWHIRQHIQRWRANEVTIIRLPVHVWEQLNRDEEGVSDEVMALVKRSQDLASFEAMLDRNEDAAWDGGLEAVEEDLDKDLLLGGLFSWVTEQQEDILRRRYGIGEDDPEPMTLEEIGVVYGVTRERIRQIEKKALDMIRERLGVPSGGGAKHERNKKGRGKHLD